MCIRDSSCNLEPHRSNHVPSSLYHLLDCAMHLSLIHICYANGSIDNTKKMVLEGLSEALHVSIEWLKGETDEYETDITDKKELQIRDVMGDILKDVYKRQVDSDYHKSNSYRL